MVFDVQLGSQLFTLLGYCCIQCSSLVKNEVKMEDNWDPNRTAKTR